jgi:hypothetical protein
MGEEYRMGDIGFCLENKVNGYLGTPKGWFLKYEWIKGAIWSDTDKNTYEVNSWGWMKFNDYSGSIHPLYPVVSTSNEGGS